MRFVLPAALAFGVVAISAFAAADHARAMRRGHEVTLSSPGRVADKLAADLESCTVNFTASRPISGAWAETLASGSYVHGTYSPPRKIALFTEGNQRRAVQPVDEILVPLPENAWPMHNLAMIEGRVSAFVKCDPRRLAEIILEPELGLREVQPYKSLMDALQK